MQATSRAIFAFSRDKLLPFSHAWTKILPLTGTPILAVWIAVFWCIAINLIGLGSYTAISGVYAVCAISLDWSYCIPIICKLAFNQFQPGPWHMGPLSKLVNILAVLWTTFSTIIFFMPTALPVSASNMNYAVVYFFGILMFCAIYWVLRGRKSYTGPLVQENLQLDDSPKQEDMGRTRRNAGVMV